MANTLAVGLYSATPSMLLTTAFFLFSYLITDLSATFSRIRGNLAWTLALPWAGQNDYVLAKEKTYKTLDGKKAGVTRSIGKGAGLLRWLELGGAGHMVPKYVSLHSFGRCEEIFEEV